MDSKTVKELREECKLRGIEGYSKLLKAQLIDVLGAGGVIEGGTAVDGDVTADGGAGKWFGIHVFKRDGLVDSLRMAREEFKELSAVQVFTHGPRAKNANDFDYKEFATVAHGLHVYVHSSYPTNPWSGDKDIFKHTVEQFVSSKAIGSRGVVLHIPKLEPEHVVPPVVRLAAKLKKLGVLHGQRIILEMKAVKKHLTQSYESAAKINNLIELLMSAGLTSAEVGICIDTAHIYAGGADIKKYETAVQYLTDIKHPAWICLIHLNGNVYDAKLRAGDKHAIPLDHEDKVWKGVSYRTSGCRAFIEFAVRHKIHVIVEVKEHHTSPELHAFLHKTKDV